MPASNQQKDKLFQLVRSLTKSEKRYFKLHFSYTSKEQKFMKLFDALTATGKYEGKKLEKKLAAIPASINRSNDRWFLYQQILKSLDSFAAEKDDYLKNNQALNNAHLLYQKGLLTQAIEVLKNAEKKANENEGFVLHLAIIDWQKKIHKQMANLGEVFRLIALEKNIIEKLDNQKAYEKLELDFLTFTMNIGVKLRDEEQNREKLLGFTNNLLLTDENKALSFKAKSLFFATKNIQCMWNGDHEDAIKAGEDWMNLFAANPQMKQADPYLYIKAVANVGSILTNYRQFDKAKVYLEELNAFAESCNNKSFYGSAKGRYFIVSLVWAEKSGNVQFILDKDREIASFIETNKTTLRKDEELVLYYEIAKALANCGEYKRSLVWVNKVLNHPDRFAKQDVQSMARILNLVIHFELENFELLEYTVTSVHRYLKNQNRLFSYETSFLNFIKTFPKIVTQKDLIAALKKLREELEDDYQRNPGDFVHFFDITTWLDAKIQKQDFSKLLAKKQKQKPV